MSMNIITAMSAMTDAMAPALIESEPRLGPTVRCSTAISRAGMVTPLTVTSLWSGAPKAHSAGRTGVGCGGTVRPRVRTIW